MDRKRQAVLLEGLSQTHADLMKEVEGFGESQMAYNPDNNKW